ncbi:autotransporter domain-containing protein [Alphaproteobacteria bacterium]|nr:autotransporter domain-containing protein [Alphaproteobacteria bacterium]
MFNYKLMTTALFVPALLVGSYAFALDVTTAETSQVASGNSVPNSDGDADVHSISSTGSVILDGLPGNSIAVEIDHADDVDTVISGTIEILDDGAADDTRYDTSNAVGLAMNAEDDMEFGSGLLGDVTLESTAIIRLLDSLERVDDDEDFVFDGITLDQDTLDAADDVYLPGAFAQDSGRIGLHVMSRMQGNLFAQSGSSILVTTNDGHGVKVDADIIGNLDLRGVITLSGSDTPEAGAQAGVFIDSSVAIWGAYRQGGSINVLGEGAYGVLIEGILSDSFQVDGSITVTGFQTTQINNAGLLASDDETPLDDNELKLGGGAVKLSGGAVQGVLINGRINTLRSVNELAELTAISEDRADDQDVSGDKTLAFHYDENRSTGSLTVYGSAPALEIDGGNYGTVVESFLDSLDDDNSEATLYSETEFAFTHSLINRGSIFANGFNDGFDATGILIGASSDRSTTLAGGILNMGSISAVAYNGDATAIDIQNNDNDSTWDLGVATGNGGYPERSLFVNEGAIQVSVISNTKTSSEITDASLSATGVRLGANVDLPETVFFSNKGSVVASSTHIDGSAVTEGQNARAFDFSQVSGGSIVLHQLLRQNDEISGDFYLGSGDLDLDVAGDVDADGNRIGDGFVTTQDVLAPVIVGDVVFGDGDNTLQISAGSMIGNVEYGSGASVLSLENPQADPIEGSSYIKPYTGFAGAIKKSPGEGLLVEIEDKSRLVFVKQETVAKGLPIATLSLEGEADLGFLVDADELDEGEALVVAEEFNLQGDDFVITPGLSSLEVSGYTVRFVQTETDLSSFADTINDHLGGVRPLVYHTSLEIEQNVDGGSNDAMNAVFALKTASELGLRTSQAASLPAVYSHFANHAALETALTSFSSESEFQDAYDQILPQYGDGTMRQLALLASSASGAVSQHMQLVKAGGRSGGEGWLQQFGDFRKQDATSEGDTLRGDSYSLAYGYDAPLFGLDAVGFFTQLSFANVDEKNAFRNEVNSEGWTFGAYLAEQFGPIGFELTAQSGTTKFDSLRTTTIGAVSDVMSAGWDGTSMAASAKFIVPILKGRHSLQAELGSDFYSLEQDAYSERDANDTALALQLGEATSELTSSYFGLRGQAHYGGGSPVAITWSPNYYVGYKSVSDYQPYAATANFVGSEETFLLTTTTEVSDEASLGFGLSAHNDYFAVELNYRGAFGDDVQVHGGGLAVRVRF